MNDKVKPCLSGYFPKRLIGDYDIRAIHFHTLVEKYPLRTSEMVVSKRFRPPSVSFAFSPPIVRYRQHHRTGMMSWEATG